MDHVSKYQYVILPARPNSNFASRDLYNKAYYYWKEYWQRTFRLKAPTFWNPVDFFRQDFIFCLLHDDQIAAQNVSTIAHFEHLITFDLPYFGAFDSASEKMLQDEGAKSLMTIEYTSVNPAYGERKTGLRLAEIMNGLALEMFKSEGFDATFAMPRRLSGLSNVTANYGYRKVGEDYQKAGWNLDVFIGFKNEIKTHPDSEYSEVIRKLWKHRVDLTKRSKTSTFAKQREYGMTNIRDQYQISMQDFCARFDELNWSDRRIYSLWLGQAYYLVRHTTRLLSLCAGYCPFEYEATHKRLLEHCNEEKGHDHIALADLAALGLKLEDLPELDETKQLIQLQYDQIKNLSACSFFGYILLLEGLAVMRAKELCERVSTSFGPRTGRFLKVHSEDDIEHIEQALNQIETFDIDDQQLAIDNLRESAAIYKTMIERIKHSNFDLPIITKDQSVELG